MKTITVRTQDPVQTGLVGRVLGAVIPAGTVLAAFGELGMGKTVLAQGLAQGLEVAEAVTSPTYIYYEEYQGRRPFCHIDAYRLELLAEEEIAEIGLQECFLPGKVAYVEWPQFIGPFLPADAILLQFSEPEPGLRELTFTYQEETQAWLAEALRGREEFDVRFGD